MAALFRYFALSCCIFLAFQQVADCVTCYYCNVCGSSSNSWNTTNLTSTNAQCYKYVYSYGSLSYTNLGASSNCTAGSDNLGGTYYCCSTNYCNEGVSLSSAFSLAFALVAAVSVFKMAMIN